MSLIYEQLHRIGQYPTSECQEQRVIMMQCKASRQQFTDSSELWNMKELMRCGEDVETKKEIQCSVLKKTMVALHTFVQLNDSPPPLQNQDRYSTVR